MSAGSGRALDAMRGRRCGLGLGWGIVMSAASVAAASSMRRGVSLSRPCCDETVK